MENAALSAADRIIRSLIADTQHTYHGRPGVDVGGVWKPIKIKNGEVFDISQKKRHVSLGKLSDDGKHVVQGARRVASIVEPGVHEATAERVYTQIYEVYKLDQLFAAKWASWAFAQEHRDLKIALAAFMLVQERSGQTIELAGEKVRDDDFRAVGEAMILTLAKDRDFNPRMLLQVHALLMTPKVREINRRAGFSTKGRWDAAIHRWLDYRTDNPRMLAGLVRAGFRRSIMRLASLSRYKGSEAFYKALRWKQSPDAVGMRKVAVGVAWDKLASWHDLTERQVCERIQTDRPSWRQLTGALKSEQLTRAVMVAAVQAGGVSPKELVILTPTLEELGVLDVPVVKTAWEAALKASEDMRAANIATRVTRSDVQAKLEAAASAAARTVTEKALNDLHVVMVLDISPSMQNAIEVAKQTLRRILTALPLNKVTVVAFNTTARIVELRGPSAAEIELSFRGLSVNGGTTHASIFGALCGVPRPSGDVVMMLIGDEEEHFSREHWERAMARWSVPVVCMPVVRVKGVPSYWRSAAQVTGVPYFELTQAAIEDAYALPRTLARLMESAPMSSFTTTVRADLAQQIAATKLLPLPVWARA